MRLASIAPWPTPSGLPSLLRALASRPLDGRPDVEIVGGGVTGCSCALTLAGSGLRVRLHEAREIASGASGRNGGFALRGGAMAYDSAREWLGHERAADYWRLTEAYVDRMRRARRRRVPADRQPSARGRRRARRAPRRVRGAARGRLRGRVARRVARPAGRPLPGRAVPPGRRGASACAARAAAGGGRGGGRRRDPRARARRRSGRARGRDGRRRHRRLSERAARRARRPDHPDPRSDDRDRARSGASVPDAALRAPRPRLLAPERRGAAARRRLPRRRTWSPSSRPPRTRRTGSRARWSASSSSCSDAGPRSRIAGQASSGSCPT